MTVAQGVSTAGDAREGGSFWKSAVTPDGGVPRREAPRDFSLRIIETFEKIAPFPFKLSRLSKIFPF